MGEPLIMYSKYWYTKLMEYTKGKFEGTIVLDIIENFCSLLVSSKIYVQSFKSSTCNAKKAYLHNRHCNFPTHSLL